MASSNFKALNKTASDPSALKTEYKAGRKIGVVSLGEDHFFFKNKLSVYYIAYDEIERCFRRVYLVPAKMCCGKGDLEVENFVVCAGGRELAEIQVPGKRAAVELMEELKRRAPGAAFGKGQP